jgi:hypothetical protein
VYVGVCGTPENSRRPFTRVHPCSSVRLLRFANSRVSASGFHAMEFRGSRVQIPPSRLLTWWLRCFREWGCNSSVRAPHQARGPEGPPQDSVFAIRESAARLVRSLPRARRPRLLRRELRGLHVRRQELARLADHGPHGLAVGLAVALDEAPHALPAAHRCEVPSPSDPSADAETARSEIPSRRRPETRLKVSEFGDSIRGARCKRIDRDGSGGSRSL